MEMKLFPQETSRLKSFHSLLFCTADGVNKEPILIDRVLLLSQDETSFNP